jgi:hypothetical protein
MKISYLFRERAHQKLFKRNFKDGALEGCDKLKSNGIIRNKFLGWRVLVLDLVGIKKSEGIRSTLGILTSGSATAHIRIQKFKR